MITVCLYGDLRQYGRRFNLHVNSPAEAVHALFTQIKFLRKHVRDGFYQVRFNRVDQADDTIADNFNRQSSGVLHIVPRVAGAGRYGQIIAGVVLIAIAWWNPFGWAAGGALIAGTYAAGIGMAVGGVAQLLTKQPALNAGGGSPESSRNTSFSNLSNTAAQGRPVPLAYGICYCGSRVISQGVESRRIQTGASAASVSTGSSVVKMVAEAAGVGVASGSSDPLAVDFTLDMTKTFTTGVAETAPNGVKYNTDFNDDSVRARNYQAAYAIGA